MVLELETTPRHVDRRERGVALGRDVPVVGNAELEAARAGLRVIRREQPAAAPVLQRKRRVRKGEHRVVEEAQPWTVRLCLVGLVVEIELARFEKPVVLSRLAGREARADQAILALAEKFHALRRAACRLALALQEEPGALEEAGIVERVVIQRRPEEAVDAALQPHAALALQLAELAVVAQELAEHAELAAPDLGRAARADLEIAHAFDLLRVDRGRIRLRQRVRCGGKGDGERREARRHAANDRF